MTPGVKFVTLTLNPALDRSGNVKQLLPSHKLRCLDARTDPGGGGINVARVLTRLGADAVAVFPAGGYTGAHLRQLVQGENVPFDSPEIEGETRESFHIRELATGAQYRFVFAGPPISQAEIERCCKRALERLTPGSYLICSGSMPPGTPPDFLAQLARLVAQAGGKFVLDSSGAAMAGALGAEIEIIKLNETELEDLAGAPVCDRDRCVAAARFLLAGSARMVAITRGEKGALLVADQQAWEADALAVKALSTVGAGDSFLAALTWGLATGNSPADSLRLAIAAGSAALSVEGTGLARPRDIERLASGVSVRMLGPAAEPLSAPLRHSSAAICAP